eukprot:CAMPEP_0182438076 /NCGR_PEP_ID=MMETSP1167-20130531/85493_1 /TAXON_ID=2988 /ORGANISM="Mallomonas Sp, Strain CCMP3275" /LENGTH=156 /DNA_ID=CAMNT_0024631251 /DNA_START=206 /DNA_END=677 /DNA_ORIENTATION=-
MATISGLSGMVVVYPIDIIKTQLQSSRVRNIGLIGSIISTTGSIISSSGVFGLWRGFPAAALGIAPEKGITFAVNDGIRDYYMANHPHQKLSLQEEIIAGTAAGVAQLVITVPYEQVKIKLQLLLYGESSSPETELQEEIIAGTAAGVAQLVMYVR